MVYSRTTDSLHVVRSSCICRGTLRTGLGVIAVVASISALACAEGPTPALLNPDPAPVAKTLHLVGVVGQDTGLPFTGTAGYRGVWKRFSTTVEQTVTVVYAPGCTDGGTYETVWGQIMSPDGTLQINMLDGWYSYSPTPAPVENRTGRRVLPAGDYIAAISWVKGMEGEPPTHGSNGCRLELDVTYY
jgi:hypothetical protein